MYVMEVDATTVVARGSIERRRTMEKRFKFCSKCARSQEKDIWIESQKITLVCHGSRRYDGSGVRQH